MHFILNRPLILPLLILGFYGNSWSAVVNTGNVAGSTTSGVPLFGNVNSTPSSVIRFEVGGAKYTTVSGQLSVTVTVDATTPVVITGTSANQSFRDDTVGAAFFGYYLTTAVRSSNQTPANTNIKLRVGTGATANRTYYLLGNGTTTPTQQSNLTAAPALVTTFATAASNTIRCGPSYSANGITGTAMNCAAGSTVANMDITQFVKVLFTDAPGTAIISKLEFTAAAE